MGLARLPAVLVLCLASTRAVAGPTGAADGHAARATGFPGAYLDAVALSLAADPLYASRLLDGMQLHLRSLAAMTSPLAVSDYLENAVMSTLGVGREAAGRLAASLGREPLDPPKASALLIGNALARPEQFREVLDGLETLKPGLGKQAATILREVKGGGDRRLLAALRAAGKRVPQGRMLTYGSDGRLDRIFDGAPGVSGVDASNVEAPDDYEGAGSAARPRRWPLRPSKRRD